MENQALTDILKIAVEIDASAADMVERCSGYQETARILHRELETMLQLHHKDPGIFIHNADFKGCVVEFFRASAMIAKDAEHVRSVGLDNAEQHIHELRTWVAHPQFFDNPEIVKDINSRLTSCEQNFQLARQYVRQLNAYVQYHTRVLKTIRVD